MNNFFTQQAIFIDSQAHALGALNNLSRLASQVVEIERGSCPEDVDARFYDCLVDLVETCSSQEFLQDLRATNRLERDFAYDYLSQIVAKKFDFSGGRVARKPGPSPASPMAVSPPMTPERAGEDVSLFSPVVTPPARHPFVASITPTIASVSQRITSVDFVEEATEPPLSVSEAGDEFSSSQASLSSISSRASHHTKASKAF